MKKIYLEYNTPVRIGDAIKITLRMPNELGFVTNVEALFNRYGERPGEEAKVQLSFVNEKSSSIYSEFYGELTIGTVGYHTFYIVLDVNGVKQVIKYDKERNGMVLDDGTKNLGFCEFFAYYPYFETPDWVKGGIMYQIFVDTFCSKDLPEELKAKVVRWDTFPKWKPDSDGVYRNDQYYGGNLKGIISKLPYIKSLNVTVIYLTPILKGGSSNRYDTINYEEIDELVGTWDDLKELREKANNLGIRIVMDVVFNHSSSRNPLIKQNPEMYSWKEKYTIPNCWWGYQDLVEFNKNSPDYFEELEKWLALYSKYTDGIRLDVADELPDFVLRFIRKNFKKYILGEVWKNAVTGDHRGFLNGDELDGVMNYQFTNAIYRYVRWGNYQYLRDVLEGIVRLYPNQALDVSPIFLSSHDIPRIPNILVGDFMKEDLSFENVWNMEQDQFWYTNGKFDTFKFRSWCVENDKIPEERRRDAIELFKIAVFLQYTLPGIPSIFAGDEVGVCGFKDPLNRKPFPWDNIDEEILNFYKEMGDFRITNREHFADSRNFEIVHLDAGRFVYKRGELIFTVDLKNRKYCVKIEK